MDKQDIISRLKDFPYSCEEYWVITGSAMVLYGIREQTHDIDMGCTSAMADQLVADGYSYQLTESGNRKFNYGDDIEIFENWKCGSIEYIEGVPVLSLDGLIEMKQELGREKDLKDIALIKAFKGQKAKGGEFNGKSDSCLWPSGSGQDGSGRES